MTAEELVTQTIDKIIAEMPVPLRNEPPHSLRGLLAKYSRTLSRGDRSESGGHHKFSARGFPMIGAIVDAQGVLILACGRSFP